MTDRWLVASGGHYAIGKKWDSDVFFSVGNGSWVPTDCYGAAFRGDFGFEPEVSLWVTFDPASEESELRGLEISRRSEGIERDDLVLPLAKLTKLTVEANTMQGPTVPAGERLPDEWKGALSMPDGRTYMPSGNVALRELAEIAYVYVRAVNGEIQDRGVRLTTAQAVAGHLGQSEGQARRRIGEARNAGMLTSTQRRKKGGELTPLAESFLTQPGPRPSGTVN